MMKLTYEEKQSILERALFLRERTERYLEHPRDVADAPHFPQEPSGSSAEERLAQWQLKAGGSGGEKVFRKRLSLDGLNMETAKGLLSADGMAADKPFPIWMADLEGVLSLLPIRDDRPEREEAGSLADRRLMNELDLADALILFLRYGERQLEEVLDWPRRWLSDTAVGHLLDALTETMKPLCSSILHHEFRLYLSRVNPLWQWQKKSLDDPWLQEQWKLFTRQLLMEGWKNVFLHYPVLARLCSISFAYWLRNVSVFLNHVEEDSEELGKRFLQGQAVGQIVHLDTECSDVHNHGKRVWIVRFSTGLKLVYKPRALTVDVIWFDLTEWMRENGCADAPIVPRSLDAGDHGWVEFVEKLPLASLEEAPIFYRRTGILFSLMYAFGGSDFQYENLIASGSHPVLIDLETLLQHRVRPFQVSENEGSANEALFERLKDSVLTTGMLPFWHTNAAGETFDWGGLTGNPSGGASANRPKLQDRLLDPQEYIDDIAAGFEEGYDWLMNRRETLLKGESPLNQLGGYRYRYIIRPSQVYADMLTRLASPEFMRDGIAYSIEIERMASAYLLHAPDGLLESLWQLFIAEQEALERRDIPIFYGEARSTAIEDHDRKLCADYFMESAWERAVRLIHQMGEEDKKFQSRLIRACLSLHRANAHGEGDTADVRVESLALPSLEEVKVEDTRPLFREAERIYEEIIANRIGGESWDNAWLVRKYDARTNKITLGPMGFGLYDGTIGLAVFMSALYRMTGAPEIKEQVDRTVRPFLQLSDQSNSAAVFHLAQLGWGSGIGGWIKGLLAVSAYLQDEFYREAAISFAARMDLGNIRKETQLDVIGGTAGLILSLLDLWIIDPRDEWLEKARICGEHLIASRTKPIDGLRLWKTGIENAPLTGFGHGASGYAGALARLYEETGIWSFKEAATEAIAYEQKTFDSEMCNWPDYRKNPLLPAGRTAFMSGWCSGAPGIGLARLKLLRQDEDSASWQSQVHSDVGRALRFALDCPVHSVDHVCCGNAGRIDFLLEASAALGRPELLDESRKRMLWVVERKRQTGYYKLNDSKQGILPNPSFFQGTSGIGYELLRCYRPDLIQSILH